MVVVLRNFTITSLQDIEHLSRAEKEALITSLAHDPAENQLNSNESNVPSNPIDETPLQEETIDLTEDSNMVVVESNESVEDSATNLGSAETELTEEQNLQISQFCELTGSDPTYAKSVLQVTHICLEVLFL